ncbi:MAG: phosphoribosylglycinamide formyltransferase [Synergistaceae bacterium]|nr:phosphoribosylglycinamide formyltransferase [Synergistaceae bacterium]
MVKIAVLVSGGGTNLQALINAQNNGILTSGRVVEVISSRSDAYALTRAEEAGIMGCVCADEAGILDELKKSGAELVVLAGYMHILSPEFLKKCALPIVNIHPSLIPSFCGKGYYGLKVHEAVLKAGVKITGATVHMVNEIPDGGEILAQKAVEILEGDTPETLQRRVMESAEWVILPQAVDRLCRKIGGKVFARPMRYPGRGIITGATPSGRKMFAYFIMGRSPSSRARVFERAGDDVIIRMTGQVSDTSLILYAPVRVCGDSVIVTNGDQTDTIFDALKSGGTFESALRTREYEPDAPHYTPRISAVITPSGYTQSILKRAGRFFYDYVFTAGKGHLIHTYDHDVMKSDVLPSFVGEPREVNIPEDMEGFADSLWSELDEDNKVSLYVRFYDGEGYTDKLFNKETM